MKSTPFLFLGVAVGAAAVVAYIAPTVRPRTPDSPLVTADLAASRGKLTEAIRTYDEFIVENKGSKDVLIQDRVASARIRKGYALAKQRNYSEARSVLLEAEREYKGTGKMVPNEGGAKDEAAYQAAICLLASGDQKQGKKALVAFIDRYPDSPNTGGAYKRLMRLTSGKERDLISSKLDDISQARSEKYFLEIAKCGPRAVAYVARAQRAFVPNEAQLVKACKTDKTGSSMAGLVNGLKLCGLQGYGYELNRRDFEKISTPAIWLQGDHFFVIQNIRGDRVSVYNPLIEAHEVLTIPELDDRKFKASVLTLDTLPIPAG
jgi:tetratricopeptide (TPR) repeat protein